MAQEVAPSAAAIAALPSNFAPEEVTLQVLQALLELALGLQDEFAASVAAAAAASIVNKDAHGAHSPLELTLRVLPPTSASKIAASTSWSPIFNLRST